MFNWVWLRKKAAAVAVLTFLVGAVGGKSFDAVWQRLFPPKDVTGEILSVSKAGLAQVEQTRESILTEIRALPEKIAASPNPNAEVQRLGELVDNLAGIAGALGRLNTTAVQVARGEEVTTVPRFASVSSAPAEEVDLEVQSAPVPDVFVSNGVGGGDTITPADRAAAMQPTLWVRMGETRRVGDNPTAYLRVTGFDGTAVTVAVNGQAWYMRPASSIRFNHNNGSCRLSYATTRPPDMDTERGEFHGFVLECGAGDPTRPGTVQTE